MGAFLLLCEMLHQVNGMTGPIAWQLLQPLKPQVSELLSSQT